MSRKPAYSKHGKKLSFINKTHTCNGCGCVLPRGSAILMWSVWKNGKRHRYRLCSRCQEPIYACDREKMGRHLDSDEKYMVRAMCQTCDTFPVCDKVDYMRKEQPGEVFWGDLEEGKI